MDKKDINSQNLLFLLSAAPLSLGCIITTGDDTATSVTETVGNSTGMTSGTTSEMTSGNSTGMTAGNSTGMSSGMVDSSGTASVDTTSAETDGPVTYCEIYADLAVECGLPYTYEEILGYCEADAAAYAAYSDECFALFEDFVACLNALPCDEFVMEDACSKENTALTESCSAK